MGCHGNTGETRKKRKLVFIYLEMSEMREIIIPYLIQSLLVLVQCKMEVQIQSGLVRIVC